MVAKHKLRKRIGILIIMLGMINVTSFAISKAKYKASGTAFTYRSRLTTLYKGSDILSYNSDKAKISGNFEFIINIAPSDSTSDYTKDQYVFTIPKLCKLNYSGGSGSLADDKFTFSKNASTTIDMSCPSSEATTYETTKGYEFIVKVNVTPSTGESYLYKSQTAVVDEIPKQVEVSGNKITIKKSIGGNQEIYDNLVSSVLDYAKTKTSTYSFITDAVVQLAMTDTDAGYLNSVKSGDYKNILGIEYSSNENEHVFTLNDNFLGYALTKYNSIKTSLTKIIYFTTDNDEEIEKAFYEYLKWLYSGTTYNQVVNYLKTLDLSKLASFVKTGENKDEYSNNGLVFRQSNQITLAPLASKASGASTEPPAGDAVGDDVPGIESNISTSTPSNSSVEVPVVASQNVNFGTDFVGTISNIRNSNSIYRDRISDNLVNTIVNDGTLLNEINSKVFGEQSDYEKYYIIKDESVNKYFALKVYRLNGINYFKIEDLQVNNYSVDDLKKLINISIDNVSFSSKKMIGVSITMDVTEFVRANPEATDAQIQGLFINVKNVVDKYLRKNYLTIVDNVEVIREDDGVSVRAKLNYQAKIY